MDLRVTKQERFQQRLIGIQGWTVRLEKLRVEYLETATMRKGVKVLKDFVDDMWIMVNTSEEKGKEKGWWE